MNSLAPDRRGLSGQLGLFACLLVAVSLRYWHQHAHRPIPAADPQAIAVTPTSTGWPVGHQE